MANKKNTLQVVVGSILILLLIGVTVLLISEKRANNELVQEFNLEKEDLENQYTDFAKQYDELKLTVSNDSLSVLLEQEQTENAASAGRAPYRKKYQCHRNTPIEERTGNPA